jgi:hypothetical protein
MEMLQLETVIGTVLGGGLTTAVARHFILKALRDLERIAETVHNISAKLSVIEVRLGQLEKLEETALSHDHKITEIQSRLKYERPASIHRSDKARMLET